ncbi:MAG TPA: hypothetical protein PLV61_12120 [Parvularculaceae bacterium]|nr:hypothetical protein [Caulobacterales bacterium]HOP19217.1 hypothetical protein [Amphiplicatus sp.]HPE31929.1 hypothetical protein [Parvularculaceae bacterium]HRX39528.1 hypothetical protein [Parvularculaceae bacterium]
MKRIVLLAGLVAPMLFATSAGAESVEDMCLRVSAEWGSTGDVAAQCSCLADKASGDAALADELTALGNSKGSDAEAYDAASDGTKAALDACSVES